MPLTVRKTFVTKIGIRIETVQTLERQPDQTAIYFSIPAATPVLQRLETQIKTCAHVAKNIPSCKYAVQCAWIFGLTGQVQPSQRRVDVRGERSKLYRVTRAKHIWRI